MVEKSTKRLIDGHFAGNEKIIARCHLLTHRGYLTKALIQSHSCITKKCPFFEKTNSNYWQIIEGAVREKKNNRDKRKQTLEVTRQRDVLIRETLEKNGHIYITAIHEEPRNLLVISYIYDERVNLSSEILFLRRELGKTIKLQARIGSEEAIERLIHEPHQDKDTGAVYDTL